MHTQEVIGVLLSLTALSSYLNYRFIKLPKSIGITLVTLVLTLLVASSGKMGWDIEDFTQSLIEGISFNETFLHGMLSFLLFAGSLHVNAMELSKHKFLVATLATVSVIISTFLVGYATYGLTQLIGIQLPFYYCLVFGALISPTDPIAVLGILKTAGAPKSLELKIAGEALFNDGMGIVLFLVVREIASGAQESVAATQIVLFFVQQGIGGLLLGALIGYFAARMLRGIDDYEVAIILTLAIVTGGYTIADRFAGVSGVLTVVVAGLVIGNSMRSCKLSKDSAHRLEAFWELIDEVLNAILFVLIGLEIMRITMSLDVALASIGAIIITIAARWISISIPVACLSRFRKFNPDVLMVMTWGGLRGGISIALALSISGPHHDFLVSITYAVVLFSMMVQGLTIGPLVRKVARDMHGSNSQKALENVNVNTKPANS